MRLLKTHELTFTFEVDGHYNADGEWTTGTITTKTLLGSLQSMRRGSDLHKLGLSTTQLPDGYLVEDAKAFYTQSNVDMLDEDNDVSPSTTTINNKIYKVWKMRDNTGFGLKVDHSVIILLKQPKANSGGW